MRPHLNPDRKTADLAQLPQAAGTENFRPPILEHNVSRRVSSNSKLVLLTPAEMDSADNLTASVNALGKTNYFSFDGNNNRVSASVLLPIRLISGLERRNGDCRSMSLLSVED